MTELFVDHGAKCDVKDERGWTAFRYAAYAGNREMIDLFVAKGADVSGNVRSAVPSGSPARQPAA